MTDPEILALAMSVREWTSAQAEANQCDPQILNGMCAIASLELSLRLKAAEEPHEIHYADAGWMVHVWIVVKGKVLDVTATQFDGPEIYFDKEADTVWWFYEATEVHATAGDFMQKVYRTAWRGLEHNQRIRDYYESRA